MFNDVVVYLRQCERFQKHKILKTTINSELLRILDYQDVAKRIGAGLCSLPEADGFCDLFACVN